MKLTEYLEREGMPASKLAERAGLVPSTISRILKGGRSPRLEVMRKIAKATGFEVSTLDDFQLFPDDGKSS